MHILKYPLRSQTLLWWHELLTLLDADESDDLYDMYQDLHYYMCNETCDIYIATSKDGKLLGIAIVIGDPIPRKSPVYNDVRFKGSTCLEQLYVLTEHRGEGVGTALVEKVLENNSNISLTVRESNPAVNMYMSLGFIVNDRIISFYPNATAHIGSEAALVMHRNVNG